MRKIMLHLPAYREPELIPTIEDALAQAKYPKRIHFGICRQFHPKDKFDNLDKYKDDSRFKIKNIHYKKAKGLAYARAVINDELLEDEDFVLQLDSHHRFTKHWDKTLIGWYDNLKKKGNNPLICGYQPYYNPFNDPDGRVQEPWISEAASFYPFGTIFIRPTGFPVDWKKLKEPVPARFLSGHFCFGPNKWAKEVRHDPDLVFAGEEINLTVRSFTHGYDLFHPHKVVVWHATMREEREGILAWEEPTHNKLFWKKQDDGRAKIRQLLRVEDNGIDLTGYDLGTIRTLRDYEKYSGIHFAKKSFQKYTKDLGFPPNPIIENEQEWEDSFMYSFYYLVDVHPHMLSEKDYDFILIAFDDEKGKGIESEYIDDYRLQNFLKEGKPIHYEKMFMTDQTPSKVVYWGHSKDRGWVERHEIIL